MNHNEILLALKEQGLVNDHDILIYNSFSSSRQYLYKVREEMFMEMPQTLEAQALAWQDGRRDFVREIISTLNLLDSKIATGGTECLNYLQEKQKQQSKTPQQKSSL